MGDNLPIFFPKDLYHLNKPLIDKFFESFGIVWDSDEKAWIGNSCRIVGMFSGFKKPATLNVIGSNDFINSFTEFAINLGAEIREVEIKDIRVKRKEEQKERTLAKEKEDYIKNKKAIEEKASLDNVIKSKIGNMEMWGMSKEFMRNWIKLEFGADISEMLGIETVKDDSKSSTIFDNYNKKERVKAKGMSFLCKNDNHAGCGGHECSCSCHS